MSLAVETLVASWAFTALACFGVILLWVHGRHQGYSPRACDVFVTCSFVVGLVVVCQTTWAIIDEHQTDHQKNLKSGQLRLVTKSLMINEALWTIVNTCMRISAGSFVNAVFVYGATRTVTQIFLFVSACHGIASVLQALLICQPISANWNPDDGRCDNQLAAFTVMESLGLVLDVVILIVPMPIVYRMKMPVKLKYKAMIAFDIGVIIVAVTGVRLHVLRLSISPDFTYSQSYLGMLSAIGAMLGVFLFTVHPVYVVLKDHIASNRSSKLSTEATKSAVRTDSIERSHESRSRGDTSGMSADRGHQRSQMYITSTRRDQESVHKTDNGAEGAISEDVSEKVVATDAASERTQTSISTTTNENQIAAGDNDTDGTIEATSSDRIDVAVDEKHASSVEESTTISQPVVTNDEEERHDQNDVDGRAMQETDPEAQLKQCIVEDSRSQE